MQTQSYGIESLWEQSDIVIKTVAIMLLVMSIATWFVMLARSIKLFYLRKQANKASEFWYAKDFDSGIATFDKNSSHNPYYNLANESKAAVDHHIQHENDLQGLLPLTEWVTMCLNNTIDQSSQKLQSGLGIMASVGSTSPFIGLFGTVWGIYHALVGISAAGSVNISEVAGPIGEALIMTAFGLVVAIPAVLGYNAISRGNKNILNKMNRFAHELHAFYITGATPKFKIPTANEQADTMTKPALKKAV